MSDRSVRMLGLVLVVAAMLLPGCARARPRSGAGVNMPPPDRPRLSVPAYAAVQPGAPRDELLAPRSPAAAPAAAPVAGSTSGDLVSTIAYKLRAGDPIVIFLRGIQPKEDQIEDIIDEGGYVKLPYLDNVLAAGKTTSQLENEIQRLYIDRQIYKHITVNVVMPSQSYFVQGEVKNPGRYPMVTDMTLLQTIATAGGNTDFADETNVKVIRAGRTERYNVRDIKRHPERDVRVEPGDVIQVERSIF
jgi:protein involved in polysaccharide export with SLBB domain